MGEGRGGESRRRGHWLWVGVTAGVVGLVLAVVMTVRLTDNPPANQSEGPPASGTPKPTCSLSALLVPSCGALFGVAANPLGDESWDTALTSFEKNIGRTVDIAHYYNSSPDLFPTAEMIQRAREPGKKRLLLLNWKPEMGKTWAQVAKGNKKVDAAIDAEAKYLKTTFPEKFFLTIHHEPEEEVDPTLGSGMTADDYRAMYRHVVQRLRQNGVTNAVFVMNYSGAAKWGSQPWFESLYPGDDVVDWIAEDPYIFGDSPDYWTNFASAVDRRDAANYPDWPGFYSWAVATHPTKPIMLGEFGIDEQTKDSKTKADLLRTVRAGLDARPQIKAVVYWNKTRFDPVGETRLDSSPTTKKAAHDLLTTGPLARQLG